MSNQCTTCGLEAIHKLNYENLLPTGAIWEGLYCTDCFIKKLRGMAKVWSNRGT